MTDNPIPGTHGREYHVAPTFETVLGPAEPTPVMLVRPDRSLTYLLTCSATLLALMTAAVYWLLPIGLAPLVDVQWTFWQALALALAADLLLHQSVIDLVTEPRHATEKQERDDA